VPPDKNPFAVKINNNEIIIKLDHYHKDQKNCKYLRSGSSADHQGLRTGK
jgi:hypothetical protein